MKQTGRFNLKWKDAANAIIMMVIANMLMIVMAAADGKFPSLDEQDAKMSIIRRYLILCCL